MLEIFIRTLPLTARRTRLLLSMFAAFLFLTSAPSLAHKDHNKSAAAQASAQAEGNAGTLSATPGATPDAATMPMTGMDDMDMDRSKMTFFERLFGWLGRLHPMIVHFPIAFFPAALFTAIVGRRRPAFAAPVQFLVVAGGIAAPFAAAAGWLAGMDADAESILTYHRWLGVAVGLSGAGLGIWAWRRPWEDRGAGMIIALTLITIAIAVQGFLGASLTHGMDHMMF